MQQYISFNLHNLTPENKIDQMSKIYGKSPKHFASYALARWKPGSYDHEAVSSDILNFMAGLIPILI